MLLLFAAVDDVVSEEEAGFVNTCADTLSALCDRDGLKGEKAPLDVKDFVTRRACASQGGRPRRGRRSGGSGTGGCGRPGRRRSPPPAWRS